MSEYMALKAATAAGNADDILYAAQQLKNSSRKHEVHRADEESARTAARELMHEAHGILGGMVNATDPAEQKALKDKNQKIQRELVKADSKIARVAEKAVEAAVAIDVAYAQLIAAIDGQPRQGDETVPLIKGDEQEIAADNTTA